ncbi:Oligomerization domain-containing protein [Polychytrium aggregatum]|uniref:Oligomerization domain-containing protein n=1 Tax=Polychytrium aggregatum TaxID=110093 RepID=UPI0022FF3407|nr:Oligomerization domain-containing protein [Polychytrium aggregatum]KAI9206697.1 Oligomerization domain-containing protein [Polychytrium aggregatum]
MLRALARPFCCPSNRRLALPTCLARPQPVRLYRASAPLLLPRIRPSTKRSDRPADLEDEENASNRDTQGPSGSSKQEEIAEEILDDYLPLKRRQKLKDKPTAVPGWGKVMTPEEFSDVDEAARVPPQSPWFDEKDTLSWTPPAEAVPEKKRPQSAPKNKKKSMGSMTDEMIELEAQSLYGTSSHTQKTKSKKKKNSVQSLYDTDSFADLQYTGPEDTDAISRSDSAKASDPAGTDAGGDDWYLQKSFNMPKGTQGKQAKFVPRWIKSAEIAKEREILDEHPDVADDETQVKKGKATLREIVDVVREERGHNIVAIDMREKCEFAEFMVIAEGRSKKHIYSIADAIRRTVKHRLSKDPYGHDQVAVEGQETDDWMVLDAGHFIVHCFTPEARAHYNLEGLWTAVRDPMAALHRDLSPLDEDDTEGEAQRALELELAGQAWEGRNENKIRIKQLEERDFMDEDELIERMNTRR